MSEDRILVLDGGLSTALENAGHSVGRSMWTGELLLTDPDAVTVAHRGFVDAGADILITGSYQLSFDGGRKAGWSEDDVERALRNSTIAARLAADEGTLVAASIGPFGAHLNDGSEFRGHYGVDTSVIRSFHERRLDVLLDTEPDLLAIETMPSLDEVSIILDLLESTGKDIPFWVSFTVSRAGYTSGGDDFAEASALVAGSDAALAVGINCSPLGAIEPTLIAAKSKLPFVVYPNAGQEWDSATMAWQGEPRIAHAEHIARWVELGAAIVGGCCGYAASDISRIASAV